MITANSSPPILKQFPLAPYAFLMALAAALISSSPAWWPKVSFAYLRPFTSIKNMVHKFFWVLSWLIVDKSESNASLFSRPVKLSVVATSCRCSFIMRNLLFICSSSNEVSRMNVAMRAASGKRVVLFVEMISLLACSRFVIGPSRIDAMTSVMLCWFKCPFSRKNSPWEKNPVLEAIPLNDASSKVGSCCDQKAFLAAQENMCRTSGAKCSAFSLSALIFSMINCGSPYDRRTIEPSSISEDMVSDPSGLLAPAERTIEIPLCS